jgi:hypothetical protein
MRSKYKLKILYGIQNILFLGTFKIAVEQHVE